MDKSIPKPWSINVHPKGKNQKNQSWTQIILQGFKSYKDQTILGPLSPNVNVIIGRNGSGKSNLFFAIRFVLGDIYATRITADERQGLLHESTGPAILSAFVEIVFDNSDQRFPTGTDTVTIRRTIGMKKDEYSLDRKSVTKSDVVNLLQSAGFSKSNPFYIVPQGRVTFLTNASDEQRLSVLQDVAGTRLYEDHRKESLDLMEETNGKRQKIQELLSFIDERLSELEEEKMELKKYQELDKERRCLEYSLFSREQQEIEAQLDRIETRVNVGAVATREEAIQKVEQEISELRKEKNSMTLEVNQLQVDLNDVILRVAQLHEEIKDCDRLALEFKSRDQIEQSRKEISLQVEQLRHELSVHEEQLTHLDTLDISSLESERNALISKMTRKFKTIEERDEWITRQVTELNQQVEHNEKQSRDLLQEIEAMQEEYSVIVKAKREHEINVANQRQSIEAATMILNDLKKTREDKMDERKSLWRKEAKIDDSIKVMLQEQNNLERIISQSMDKSTAMGLNAIKRLGLPGVYGPLYSLISLKDPIYETCVDIVAGASLFHLVVQDDSVASRILSHLESENIGRVTLMPLNRLKNTSREYPRDCESMVSVIKYDERIKAAIEQVFGKTVICSDIHKATLLAKSHNINAITLDGDRVDHKGAMTGGFISKTKNRLSLVVQVGDISSKISQQQNELTETRRLLQIVDQELNSFEVKIQEQTFAIATLDRNVSTWVDKDVAGVIEDKKKSVSLLTRAINEGRAQLQNLEQERSAPLTKQLSRNEQSRLNQLNDQIQQCKSQLLDNSATKLKLSTLCQVAKAKIQHLEHKLESLCYRDVDSTAKKQLAASLEDSISTMNSRLSMLSDLIDKNELMCIDLERQLGQQKSDYEEMITSMNEQSKGIEHSKGMLIHKRDECIKKIRELGVVPEEIIKESNKTLMARIQSTMERLRHFSHVNKKAFEQYSYFTSQQETLTKRRQELDNSWQAINNFITVLDQRKDEAIHRTFSQVSDNFSTVFKKLVPNGSAKLAATKTEVSNRLEYSGVTIQVSFSGNDHLYLEQLSGGQKSLVALAFIFSIQMCDPAPFYLFDEIDANLDAAHRTSVAEMVKSLGKDAQFIVTTFRPEMVQVGDSFFGVLFGNKVSRVDSVAMEAALEFIETEKK